jgi:hypothetical protein
VEAVGRTLARAEYVPRCHAASVDPGAQLPILNRFPAAEQAELAETFAGYGAAEQTAARMAEAVSRDPDTALRVHTREELGVDPFELPSALVAGVSSLIAFSAGHSSRCCPTWRERALRWPPPWASPRWRC